MALFSWILFPREI